MAILEFEQVDKIYTPGFIPRKMQVLHGLSFAVEEGQVFGFLGPNGAGKTTTIKLLVGLLFPDRGTVKVRGCDTRDPRSREQLGFLPENPYFYDYLTGREFLDFYGRLYGLASATRRQRIDALLGRLGIDGAAGLALKRYSKGMLQRIGFAQALLCEPSLLILDEPMSGLDPIGRRLFRDLILEERARGATVFFSSHILQDAEMLCDRVAIVAGGRLLKEGTLSELLAHGDDGFEFSVSGVSADAIGDVEDVKLVAESDGALLLRASTRDAAERSIAKLTAAGGRLDSLAPARATLEDLFLNEIRAVQTESVP